MTEQNITEPIEITPLTPRPQYDGRPDKRTAAFNGIRAENNATIRRLESVGASLNMSEAQLEFYMAGLVEAGALTQDQADLIQYNWQVALRKQLAAIVRQVEEQMEKARKAAMAPKLIVPGKG